MARLVFKIRSKKNPAPIFIRLYEGKQFDFMVKLPINVNPEYWNPKKEEVKNLVAAIDKKEINNKLIDIRAGINQRINMLNGVTSSINKAWLENALNEILNKTIVKKEYTLMSFFEEYLEEIKVNPSPITGKLLSIGRQKNIKITYNKLIQFQKEKYGLNFDNIDINFYRDFTRWFEDQNFSVNYIGKHIMNMKSIMNESYERKIHNNLEFKSRKFKTISEETEEIYLTIDELKRIEAIDKNRLSSIQDISRDLFLIGAYTGLRISDYNNLSKENITTTLNVPVIKVATKKTGEPVVIPIHPVIKRILQKYDNQLPPKISDAQLNKNIKYVGKLAEINSSFAKAITKGGERIQNKDFKHNFIKSHTARRSFCTNAYLSGMDTIDIMAISGHKTESSFLKYIRVTKDQIALRMSEHRFFKD